MNAIRRVVNDNVTREAALPAAAAGIAEGILMVGAGMAIKWLLKTMVKKILVRAAKRAAAKKAGQAISKKAAQGAAQKVLLNPNVLPKAARMKAAKKGLSDKEIDQVVEAVDKHVTPKVQKAFFAEMVDHAVSAKKLSPEEGDAFKKGDEKVISRKAKKAGIKPSKPKAKPAKGEEAPEGKKGKGVKPPKGFEPIPGKDTEGYRRKKKGGEGYEYWYPKTAALFTEEYLKEQYREKYGDRDPSEVMRETIEQQERDIANMAGDPHQSGMNIHFTADETADPYPERKQQ